MSSRTPKGKGQGAGSSLSSSQASSTFGAAVTERPSLLLLKPADVIRDLATRAKQLPAAEFLLPNGVFTRKAISLSTQLRARSKSSSTKPAVRPPLKLHTPAQVEQVGARAASKEPLPISARSLPTSTRSLSLPREPAISIAKSTSLVAKEKPAVPLAPKRIDAAPSTSSLLSARTAPIVPPPTFSIISVKPVDPSAFSIISVKPADASLLPPSPAITHVVQPQLLQTLPIETTISKAKKKSCLESLVTKINLNKKEVTTSSSSSSSSSNDVSTTMGSSDSSSSTPSDLPTPDTRTESRRNKRKSTEPLKMLSEAEFAALEQAGKRGRKKKNKAGKKGPGAKKMKVEEATEQTVMVQKKSQIIAVRTQVEAHLPPRIIVAGQEPGTMLEWDEEEIIILRAGEEPEQRPPTMQRKQGPKEEEEGIVANGRALLNVDCSMEEGTTMGDLSIDIDARHKAINSPLILDASQSSAGSQESGMSSSEGDSASPPLPIQTTAATAASPEHSVSHILSTLTTALSTPGEKRETRASLASASSSLHSSASSLDSTTAGRMKRAIRIRSRYSPDPDDGASVVRCGMESAGSSQSSSPAE